MTNERKRTDKKLTQQQFSRYSTSLATATSNANIRANSPPLQEETKVQIGIPYNDTFGITSGVFPDQVQVPFTEYGSEYSFFTLDADTAFLFTGVPKGRSITFTLDITVDATSPPIAISFDEVLTPPTLAGNQGDHYILYFVGSNRIDPEGVQTLVPVYEYVGGTFSAGGGGGLSEPVILTVNEITPQTLPTTSVVNWSKNPNHITLDRDVEFSFANLPASPKYEGVLVIIDVDATGGFESPVWPASLTNPPIISTAPLTRTSVMLYTIDNGTVVTHATSVGSSTGGGALLSQVVIDTTKNWVAQGVTNFGPLTGVTAVQIVDVGSAVRGSITGDVTTGLTLATVTGGKFSIQDVITPIATFDNAAGLTMEGTHGINLSKNIINTVGQIQFDRTVAFSPSVETGISFDNTLKAINYNVGLISDIHTFRANGELLASITRIGSNLGQISASAMIGVNTLQATQILFLGSFNNTTPSNGDIWRDSGDGEFKFRQNNATESLGGIPSSIADLNTSFTANGTSDTLTGTFDGDSNKLLVFRQGQARLEQQGANYVFQYLRNDIIGGGTAGDIITLILHNGFDDAVTPAGVTYYEAFSQIASPTPDAENGEWTEALMSKGSLVPSYNVEGGAGIINTNILHTFSGSALLKSNQDGDQAVFRFERNDTSTANGDIVGTLNFRAENSVNSVVPYGSFQIEIENNVNIAEIGRATINLLDNGITVPALQMSHGALVVNKTTTTGSEFADLTLLKTDTTSADSDSVAEINFRVFDDPTTRNYARIKTNILDVNNAGITFFEVRANGVDNITAMQIQGSTVTSGRTFVELNSGARIGSDLQFQVPTGSSALKIFPALNQLGLTFDNTGYTVGTNGTLAPPNASTIPASAAAATIAFGTKDFAIGFHDSGSAMTMFVKQLDGNWSAILFTYDALI